MQMMRQLQLEKLLNTIVLERGFFFFLADASEVETLVISFSDHETDIVEESGELSTINQCFPLKRILESRNRLLGYSSCFIY